ncbi:unnamed protein product [Echinostoma caproni]|uniref:SUZ domain-containing protein n=1 Tax=Echinostoma caproni TaxID=27848 RepID=A0A183AE04_9TREM|nr:unnamed protein product [Echinostoma caproni]
MTKPYVLAYAVSDASETDMLIAQENEWTSLAQLVEGIISPNLLSFIRKSNLIWKTLLFVYCSDHVRFSLTNQQSLLVKTLEQREADYAAARRRIMGSESPKPEPDAQAIKGVQISTVFMFDSPHHDSCNLLPELLHFLPINCSSAIPAAAPVATNGMLSDFRIPNANIPGATVPSARSVRQGLAVVNVPQKLQQQQQQTNGARQMLQPHQQPQRILTASSSSPSILSPTSRTSQPLPLFPSQVGNASVGLLPTPPGFNYSAQNASLNAGDLHHSQSAALALMHHFTMLQQQYQQALNGFQSQLISPIVSNVSHNSLGHLNFSSAVSSQSGIAPKYEVICQFYTWLLFPHNTEISQLLTPRFYG